MAACGGSRPGRRRAAAVAAGLAASVAATPGGAAEAVPVEEGTFCLAFFMSEERIHARAERTVEVARVREKTVPLFRALADAVGRDALSEAVADHWADFRSMHGRMEPAELRAFAARSAADCDALLAVHGIGGDAGVGEGGR